MAERSRSLGIVPRLFTFISSLLITALVISPDQVSSKQLVLHPNPVSTLNLRKTHKGTTLVFSASDDGKIAFVSAGQAGAFIISLENSQEQVILSQTNGTHVQDVYGRGNYMFISDQFKGASIYNITDLKKPEFISSVSSVANQTQASIVTTDGLYWYVLNNGFVHCFKLTDLYHPTFIKTLGIESPYSYRLKFNVEQNFIVVSNHFSGVQILDIRNKDAPLLRASDNPVLVTWDCVFTKDSKVIYVVDALYGLYAADISVQIAKEVGDTTTYPITFEFIYFGTDLEMMSLYLTNDNLHMMIGFRSIGIYLFALDPTNYKSVTFVQHLRSAYMTLSIMMPLKNQDILLATNGVSFMMYQVVEPILNQDFPNLFNTFQSSSLVKVDKQLVPRVFCMPDQKHIITINLTDSFDIYNIEDKYSMKKVVSVPRTTTNFLDQFVQAEFSKDGKYVYITSSRGGIDTYDITDLTAPVRKGVFLPLPFPYNQVLTFKLDSTNSFVAIANGFYGVQYMYLPTPDTGIVIGAYLVPQACGFQECLLLADNVRMVCSCREIGVFFFEYDGTPDIKLRSIYYQLGSESSTLSADQKTLYACLGFQGINIVDISNFLKPTQVGRLILKGWTQSITLLFNEKFGIVSQIDIGQIALVNIEDPENPYIFSLTEFQDEDSNNNCLTSDATQLFTMGVAGVRNLNIVTTLKIHTQIQIAVFADDGTTVLYYKTLSQSDPLLVGEVATFTFVPLYTEKTVTISDVKYYRYFKKETIPSWMTYLPENRQIQMTVDKKGVVNDFSTETNGENILILEIIIQLSASDFILTGTINQTVASLIFSSLKSQGYLDYYGSLTDKLDSKSDFNLNFYDSTYTEASFGAATVQIIQDHIKKVLVFSKFDYPIRFFVHSSLVFNFGDSSSRMLGEETNNNANNSRIGSRRRRLASSTSVISTPSKQITVFLQILENGVFVKKTLEGVLSSYADDLSSVRIQGQTSYVDGILQRDIQVSNSTADLSKVNMTVLIQDSSNYDQEIVTSLNELKFASFHKPILVNHDKPLRQQLQLVYPNSDLPVEQRFQFSFDLSSFTQADNLALTYKAFIVDSDGSETEIQTGLWIEFNSASLGFSGQRTINYFKDSTRIKIVASDSYSEATSTFDLNFLTIPFFYIIQVGVSVIGPLLGVLGIWKYRHEIHLFVAERHNMYKDEIAIMGQVFKKQIVLFSSLQSNGEELMKQFLKSNVNFLEELNVQYQENKQVNMPLIMSLVEKFYQPIQNRFPDIDPREFDFEDSRLVRVIKRVLYQNLVDRDQNTKLALAELKKYAIKTDDHHKDWYKRYIVIIPKIVVSGNQVVRMKVEPAKDQQEVDVGQLQAQFNEFLPKIKSENSERSKHAVSETITEQGVVSNRNAAAVAEHLKGLASPSLVLPLSSNKANSGELEESEYLNVGAFTHRPDLNANKKDDRNNIDDLQKDQFTDLNPFPEMIILQHKIQDTFRELKFDLNYDFHLLSEMIALEASGLQPSPPGGMNPAVGESIHQSAHDLYTLQAYRRNTVGIVNKTMQMLNMAYTPIGLVRNNPLPKWLNYQIVDGIVNLWGEPTLSDETEILIRIINKTLITVHSFRILIQDKERHDIRDMNLLRKVTQKIGKNVKPRTKMMTMVHSSVKLFSDQQERMQPYMMNSEILASGDLANHLPQHHFSKEDDFEKAQAQSSQENHPTPRPVDPIHLKQSEMIEMMKNKIDELSEKSDESNNHAIPKEVQNPIVEIPENNGQSDDPVISLDTFLQQLPAVKQMKSFRDMQSS